MIDGNQAAATASTIEALDAAEREQIASQWIETFFEALQEEDRAALEASFLPNGTFRDLLALSWDFRNAVGTEEIVALLSNSSSSTPPLTLALREGTTPEAGEADGTEYLGALISFTTQDGFGNGYVQLSLDSDGSWKAFGCVLALDGLNARPERIGANREQGRPHGPTPGRVAWNDAQDPEFERSEPAVVILGAGHNGLMLAARLRAMGVSALVIERNARIGDNWRNRYTALALHTPIAADHLPYLDFPKTWTRFTPKDKLGDFLESYARLLDIPVWTGSNAENVRFDESTGHWNLDIVRADGTVRSLYPEHLVFATGINGSPRLPELPGRDAFTGRVVHAGVYEGHKEWKGKRAVVVGTGVSGHDIAQDLAEQGVDVTMIQRSETIVIDGNTFHDLQYANYREGGPAIEDADLMGAIVPFGELPTRGASHIKAANEADRALLDALEKVGFKLGTGPNGTGVFGSIFGEGATGYHYNVGAAELVADGTIKLEHGSVSAFTESGIELDNGTRVDADLVVFATGYRPADDALVSVLGADTAEKLKGFNKVGDDREYGRLWRKSGMEGLWFMYSLGIDNGRFYSKLLALQIAAVEEGIAPAS